MKEPLSFLVTVFQDSRSSLLSVSETETADRSATTPFTARLLAVVSRRARARLKARGLNPRSWPVEVNNRGNKNTHTHTHCSIGRLPSPSVHGENERIRKAEDYAEPYLIPTPSCSEAAKRS